MNKDIAVAAAVLAAVGRGRNLLAIPLRLLINLVFAPGPVLVASIVLSLLALWRVPAKIDLQNLKFGMAGLVIGTALAGTVAFVIDSGPRSHCVPRSASTYMLGWFGAAR
mgnify:CR=1 FL=1|jgi:hypothetical protein